MSMTLKTCYSCGRIIQGILDSDKKKPSRLGECWKCQEKREREEWNDENDNVSAT